GLLPVGHAWNTSPRRRPGDSCELTLDPNTANRNLILFDNNTKVAFVDDEQPYPDHPERFDDWKQILCRNGLTGRCYWEVEWEGWVYIAVSYRGIRRTGASKGCWFGWNNQSWSLRCSEDAVYVDCPAGTLSFYRVSSNSLIHLHTFSTTFTETLYPGFRLFRSSSVSLCSL
uniref:SPRY-associated domain-containing protein n=1 Tax=Maylandia zebra TaxID=106582 RepID=A0A3P9C7F1_9CICH